MTGVAIQVHHKCMAVKTITIDMEAYEILSRAKKGDQSFSEVIKAHFGTPMTVGRLLERMKSVRIGKDALHQMERQVQLRKRDRVRVVKL